MPIKVEALKAGLHQLLKGGGDVGQPEGHSITLIESQQPCGKCGQLFALWMALMSSISWTWAFTSSNMGGIHQ